LLQTKIWNFFDFQTLKAGYSKRLNLKNKHRHWKENRCQWEKIRKTYYSNFWPTEGVFENEQQVHIACGLEEAPLMT
jgi:hypothetical protein